MRSVSFFFFKALILFYFIYLFKVFCFYLFIYGCAGSSPLREGPLQLWQAGDTPHRGARACHHRGLSRRGAQAADAQAQQLWLSAIVAHGPSRSTARGIFPDQGSNPCPLHWQADSQPLRHQGSPALCLLTCGSWLTSFSN